MHPQMTKKEIFYEKNAPQARFFITSKCAAGKTYQTKCTAGRIFWLSPNGYPVLLMQ